MGWEERDDKKIIVPDKPFVSCDEDYEKDTIIEKLTKEWKVSKEEAEQAVNECCKEEKAPRPRDEFIECLRRKLGM